jgi:Ankyrin repeats (many copies)
MNRMPVCRFLPFLPGLVLVLAVELPVQAARAASRCDELWAAAMADDVKRMAELINEGVNVNCRDPVTAETPLMAAATNGFVDTVRFLLTVGADPNMKNAQGETALELAQAREAPFSKLPNFAELAKRLRQVIAVLEPRTAKRPGRKPPAPLEVKDAEPDMLARLKLESAQAALMGGFYKDAMGYLVEVLRIKGVSDVYRGKHAVLAADLGMRTQDWALAKVYCEKALSLPGANPEDQAWCTETLKTLRKYHAELFK